MRIEQYNAATIAATEQVKKPGSDSVSAFKKLPVTVKSNTEDKTTFSSGNDTVKSLTQTALESTPSRASKVESLKLAVTSAQYQLDAAKIAEAITTSDV